MRIRKFTTCPNVVAEIDELIIELTYIKNGENISLDKLKHGIETIGHIISLSAQAEEQTGKERLELNPVERRYIHAGKYKVGEHKLELQDAQKSIQKLIENPLDLNTDSIERIQELLLKISVPLWNDEVSFLIARNNY